jgi:hypothetical protein
MVRTLQQSGTETQTFQDYLGNTYSTTTSGIQTPSNATFQGYLGGGPPAPPNIASLGSIFISKGVISTRVPKALAGRTRIVRRFRGAAGHSPNTAALTRPEELLAGAK